MRSDPEKDDWCELVKSDFENINLKMSDLQIQDMNPTQYKSLIKKTVREATFLELKKVQESHQKRSLMHHEDLNSPKSYLVTNKLTNKEISVLFNLRCQSVRGIRENFHRQYYGDLNCPLCHSYVDSQEHALKCSVLMKHIDIDPTVKYEHIYGTIEEQIPVAKLYFSLLKECEKILDKRASQPGL